MHPIAGTSHWQLALLMAGPQRSRVHCSWLKERDGVIENVPEASPAVSDAAAAALRFFLCCLCRRA